MPLQEYDERILLTDPEDEQASAILSETYADVLELATTTDGELGDALDVLQPLLEQYIALTGDDEQAAQQAKEAHADLTEEQVQAIDEAADFVNQTCELTMLL